MINKEEEVKGEIKTFDPRIVQTVRDLKSKPFRHSDLAVTNKAKEENENMMLSSKYKSYESDKTYSKGFFKESISKRISIDGSGTSTEYSNKKFEADEKISTYQINKKNSTKIVFPHKNVVYKLKKPKTKSDFRQNLMNDNNLIKYKAICLNLLREDEELSKIFEITVKNQINPSQSMQSFLHNNYDSFLEHNFFSDSFFLYKLESVLMIDNGKNKKEKFFKDEIKQFLNIKYLDIQFESRIANINSSIDCHVKRIEEFKFFD